jgi:hypothetical protein
MSDGKNWSDWQNAVLQASERHDREIEALRREVAALSTKIAVLEFRAGGWGAIGAGVVIIGALLAGKL